MKAERTRWFSAMTEPPVNGGPDAMYERRCDRFPVRGVWCALAAELRNTSCDVCQWRGLTERGVRQRMKGAR